MPAGPCRACAWQLRDPAVLRRPVCPCCAWPPCRPPPHVQGPRRNHDTQHTPPPAPVSGGRGLGLMGSRPPCVRSCAWSGALWCDSRSVCAAHPCNPILDAPPSLLFAPQGGAHRGEQGRGARAAGGHAGGGGRQGGGWGGGEGRGGCWRREGSWSVLGVCGACGVQDGRSGWVPWRGYTTQQGSCLTCLTAAQPGWCYLMAPSHPHKPFFPPSQVEAAQAGVREAEEALRGAVAAAQEAAEARRQAAVELKRCRVRHGWGQGCMPE